MARDAGRSVAPDRVRRSAPFDPGARPLPRRFYERPAEEVARALLGCMLVSTIGSRCVAEIVETEAYVGPEDDASHAAARRGRTARNEAMFGPAGHAYVYLIYGMHWCLNAVTGETGFPAAVLIRAARPVEGLGTMRARRPARSDRDLLRGPGNLARALGVEGDRNGRPRDEPPFWIEAGAPVPERDVRRGPRVGITRAADWPLRFWIHDSPFVSARVPR